MKFKTLNEEFSLEDIIARRFKGYKFWTEDGGRYWYFSVEKHPEYDFIVGPVDDEPKNIKDFSNLITLKNVKMNYSKKDSDKMIKELNSRIDDFATRLKRAFKF